MADGNIRPFREIICHPMGIMLVAVALVLTLASPGLAHKVFVYAWVEGDTVRVESYFGANKKVMNSPVEVFDPSGRKLLDGRTNDQGEFSFKIPGRTDLRIVVEAGMGHRAEYTLKEADLPAGPTESRGTDSTQVRQESATSSPDKMARLEPAPADTLPAAASTANLTADQVRTIVEKALDARLHPIIRTLAQMNKEQGPRLSNIIGGIGYIFGLMGLAMYFRSKRK
ncbi:MAG: hypothetical protein HQK60_09015 [Deltaproteobacteria bacterium]|nr:hypothetical protein [Deltaproteobacteria bacterium]